MRTYLDHNATSPLRPAVRAAMMAALDMGGNGSSLHAEGRKARALCDEARETLAAAVGVLPAMVIFTSGGSEANTLAIRGVEAAHLVISAIEHPSVIEAARATGVPLDFAPVDADGQIDLARLGVLLGKPNTLVSVMLANNETGVIQPVAEIARLVHEAGGLLHVDASQAIGKLPVNFQLLGADLLTLTAHKTGGPTGIGALIVADRVVLKPLIAGGGQELRRRAGTENLCAIAGFAALMSEPLLECSSLRDAFEAGLMADGEGVVGIVGAGAPRLSNTSCFAVAGVRADTLLMGFDLAGVAVSSGAACSSGKVGRSHVLAAMGETNDAIRVSFGWSSRMDDVTAALAAWRILKGRLRPGIAA